MNTYFKSALKKIKAEDDLIKKTKCYLNAALENQSDEKLLHFKKRSGRYMKKIVVASLAAVLVICAFIGGYTYFKTPVAYICLDINPSVELGINVFNKVVSVEGINEDGKAILEDQDIINNKISDVVEKLVYAAKEKNFIKDDGSTIISITTQSNDENKAVDLQDLTEQSVTDSVYDNDLSVIVYKDCSDLSMRTEAKSLGISPGKFKIIKSLQALDPTATVEQLKDLKVSDIMLRAHEIIGELNVDDMDTELDENQKDTIKNIEDIAKEEYKRITDAARIQFEATKTEAKANFEEVKKQAETIKKEAKVKAEELREQAQALIKNTAGMTEAEKSLVKAQAEELRKQAEVLMNEAEKQAEELKEEAEKQKDEAIAEAEKIKDYSERKRNDAVKSHSL